MGPLLIAGEVELQAIFADELDLAKRLLEQQKTDRNKLYSLHAPEVECISKGKAHKRYEFGVKASIAATNKSNFLLGGITGLAAESPFVEGIALCTN